MKVSLDVALGQGNKRTGECSDLAHLNHICPQMSERLLDVENEAMLKIVELEKQLMQTNKELDQLRVSVFTMETTISFTWEVIVGKHCSFKSVTRLQSVQEVYASANSQVHTLRRMVREKDQTIRRQGRLERQAQEAQQAGAPGAPQLQRGEGDGGVAESASPSPPPCSNLSPR